jgi:negative regulator of flagellin synthesis FlgM
LADADKKTTNLALFIKEEPMNINTHKPPENQGPNQNVQNAHTAQKPPVAEPRDKPVQSQGPTQADRVNISDRSKEIADIMAAANQLPDVRTDKVQQIKQSIEAGTYTVDPSKIAASILKDI